MKVLTRDELKRMQDKHQDFILLNVLSEESFRKAHIPGSSNIPLGDAEFLQKVTVMIGPAGKDRTIVSYCAGFRCSASKDAARRPETAGFQNVYAYEGGMEDWADAGYPLTEETLASQ